MKTSLLPTNDLAFGAYPQRDVCDNSAGWSLPWSFARLVGNRATRAGEVSSSFAESLARERTAAGRLSDTKLKELVELSGSRTRADGLTDDQCAIALAAVAEMMVRTIGLSPFESQTKTAYHLLHGRLVEMQTGEGKTLAAALAGAVAASAGSSVIILTANDYLVERDHQYLAPFYNALGFSTQQVLSTTDADARRTAWQHPIVYSNARELAFDYLRDHLRSRGNRDSLARRAMELTSYAVDERIDQANNTKPSIPGLCFCIVDEADSLLLDEATMPLIVATAAGVLDVAGYRTAYTLSESLVGDKHFKIDLKHKRAQLTTLGSMLIGKSCASQTGDLKLKRRAIELVETAVAARLLYRKDRDYAVLNDAIALIDEQTGRIAEGRQWQGGLQAMVQIKEGLEPTAPARTNAQITYQDFFPRFMHLCGMSGTLRDARREFQSMYRLPVARVPLTTPSQLKDLGCKVFSQATDKWDAIVQAISEQQQRGRPVLVGNASVQDSMHLSGLLHAAGVQHQVLNATQCSEEAASLARAGRAGVVTVTTNMAGRGTDIKLSEVARRNGGLHVIATMRNRSRRIDRQLFGRAGRQGDPGTHQCVVSLQDALLQLTWSAPLQRAAITVFDAIGGRAPRVWEYLFYVSQRLQQKRDCMTRAALRAANQGRHRQFGFVGRPE